jgi:hypothetical protein
MMRGAQALGNRDADILDQKLGSTIIFGSCKVEGE